MDIKIDKIAYLGYDFFHSCFDALIDNGYNVKWLFISERDNIYEFNDLLLAKAKNMNIEIIEERITAEHIKKLKEQGCDLIISAAYPFKIPIISDSPYLINIHPALLPIGRGPWPLPHIILKNHQISGVTIHKVNDKFDEGDIIVQDSFKISKNENLETLSCKTQILAKNMLILLMKDFEKYWHNAHKQGKGEYWGMPSDKERTLDWNLSTIELDKIIRAFGKFDSFATFDDKEWIIQDATTWIDQHTYSPGTIVHRTNKEVIIACCDGYVCLRYYKIDPDFKIKEI